MTVKYMIVVQVSKNAEAMQVKYLCSKRINRNLTAWKVLNKNNIIIDNW